MSGLQFNKKILTVTLLLVGCLLLFAFLVTFYVILHRELGIANERQIYSVENGETLDRVITDLVEQGIVDVPVPAGKIYARWSRSEGSLKAGEFELTRDMNLMTLLTHLRKGQVVSRYVTFPEGWRFTQWREHLRQQQFIKQTLDSYTDNGIMQLLGMAERLAEGNFFPDTYSYTRGETDLAILRRSHTRMKEVLEQEWAHRSTGSELKTPYDALILASIVEKETGYEPDRTRVASVFINRLKKGMRLQTDPTVIYGISDFDGDLKRTHLKQATPYNTYVITGLPPTPICNPGLASIRAALNPEITDYYYFVARGDGASHFSQTLDEHNRAVTEFQKTGRVENYQSRPGN